MSKDLLAKYYQDNKEILQKIALERNRSFSKEEKEKKSDNTSVKYTKIYRKLKCTNCLSIEKKYYNMGKNALF